MKKINIIIVVTILAFTTAIFNSCCKKKTVTPPANILNFDLPFLNIGVIPIGFTFPLGTPYQDNIYSQKIATYSDSLFKANNSDISKIISVKAKTLSMTITAPSGATFEFIDSLNIFMSKKDGSEKILVGSKGSIPSTATSINMIVSTAELKSYLTQDSVIFIMGGNPVGGKTMQANTAFNYEAIFGVQANP